MEKHCKIYDSYIDILKKELVVAMGCTEPIAVAFCAAKARELLGERPKKVRVQASGNIIKNVKSVIVPHTNGLRGLEAATAVGIFYGDASRELEVISDVTADDAASVKCRLCELDITVEPLISSHVLDLVISVSADERSVSVHIEDEQVSKRPWSYRGRCW